MNIKSGAIIKICLIITITALVSACASSNSNYDGNTRYSVGQLEVASKNAEQQIIVFQREAAKEKYCMSPAPDAVATRSEGFSVAIPKTGLGEADNIGADILGGRNPTTLISRALLYRTCELSLNLQLSKEEALALYRDTLGAITKIAASGLGTGSLASQANTAINQVPNTAVDNEHATKTSDPEESTSTSSDSSAF
ncbi:hypothetical protein ACSLBF_18545 (plasmid) [Pseudoalteromonas sp. T1lg65]|uniref:hypothetical protein n=1 Tax=Pseudoalteromonas sp. T1lg65 TaxID=2077101 RepID=UPI003F797B4A